VSAALDVGTPEWVAARRHTLGASEVATALGLIPDSDVFSRPIDVWLEKTGAERVTPIARGRTDAGNRLEAVVRDWYGDLSKAKLKQSKTILHPDHPWVSCTPDSLVLGADGAPMRNVQVKLVGARASFGWPGQNSIDDFDGSLILNSPDGIPQYYRVQVEWEMGILNALYGINETHLVALLGGTDLRVYEVPRDPELYDALFKEASQFWETYVVGDTPPPPDGSNAFKRFLNRKFPQAEREDLPPMPANVEEIARRYARARSLESKAKDAKELAANQLRDAIGGGLGYWTAGLKVQWRNTQKGRQLDVRETS
jgi:predicted phage-related endonuclease